MADTHIYMRLPALSGESTASGYKEDIELESITWGMRAKTGGAKSDAAEKDDKQVQLGEVSISKHFDMSSPGIMKRVAAQRRSTRPAFTRMSIVYADVVPTKLSGDHHLVPVLEYVLHDCFIESMNLSASGSSKSIVVTEEITIKFMKIEVTYHPPTTDRGNRSRGILFQSTASAGKKL